MKPKAMLDPVNLAKILRLESLAILENRKACQKLYLATASPSQRRTYGNLYFNPEVLEEVKG